MKFSTLAVVSLFYTLAAAGPLFRRARSERLSFRQAGPFLNTSSAAIPPTEPNTEIELIPIDLVPETTLDLTSSESLATTDEPSTVFSSDFTTTTEETQSQDAPTSTESNEVPPTTEAPSPSTVELVETVSTESITEITLPSETDLPPPAGDFVISFGSKSEEATITSQTSEEVVSTPEPAANTTLIEDPASSTPSTFGPELTASSAPIADEITVTEDITSIVTSTASEESTPTPEQTLEETTVTEDFTSIITSTASEEPAPTTAPAETDAEPSELPVLDDEVIAGNNTGPGTGTVVDDTENADLVTPGGDATSATSIVFEESTESLPTETATEELPLNAPTFIPTNSSTTATDAELNPPLVVTDEPVIPGAEGTRGPQFTFTTISETPSPEDDFRSAPVTSTVTSPSSIETVTSTASSVASFVPPTQETDVEDSTQALAPVPTIISELPVATTISEETYASNLEQANDFNEVFAPLTENSPCSAGTVACINGATATCSDATSTFTLAQCDAGSACYALPMEETEGVYVGCYPIADAKAILAGAPPSLESPVEQPEEEEVTTIHETKVETIFVTATPEPAPAPSPEASSPKEVPTPSPRAGGPDRVVEPQPVSTVTPIPEPAVPADGPIDLQPLDASSEDRSQPEGTVELANSPAASPSSSEAKVQAAAPTPSPILLVEEPVTPTPTPQPEAEEPAAEEVAPVTVTAIVTTTERWERVVEIVKTETETVTAYMSADVVGQWQKID